MGGWAAQRLQRDGRAQVTVQAKRREKIQSREGPEGVGPTTLRVAATLTLLLEVWAGP